VTVEPWVEPRAFTPGSYEELADLVRQAEASRRCLIPAGLGNHLPFSGPAPAGAAILSLARLSRVVRYEPGDFTIGVQAGMPLDGLRAVLAENDQEIPVDFASSPCGTVGGALAQNRSGPRRGRYGTLRQSLIGVVGLRGGGRIYKAGGMVVKNVAGYDVMKLLIGSQGTLGPILETNFKLRPLPAARRATLARFESPARAWELARAIRERALEPAVLSVLSPAAAAGLDGSLGRPMRGAWAVLAAFEGNASAVSWLEGQVQAILPGPGPEEGEPLDAVGYAKAIEYLSRAREAEAAEEGSTVVLSLAAPVSDGPAMGQALQEALAGGSTAAGGVWVQSDVYSGLHLARLALGGTKQAAETAAEAAIGLAREVARRFGAIGRILSSPAPAGAPRQRPFDADPNPAVAERVRRAFDPRGVFGLRPETAECA
jgi:FAD/FMN-containing dehydrogenase